MRPANHRAPKKRFQISLKGVVIMNLPVPGGTQVKTLHDAALVGLRTVPTGVYWKCDVVEVAADGSIVNTNVVVKKARSK